MSDSTEAAVDVSAVAEMLNVSPDTVYALALSNQIPSFKVGRLRRFYLSEVRAKLSAPVDAWQRPSRSTARRRAA